MSYGSWSCGICYYQYMLRDAAGTSFNRNERCLCVNWTAYHHDVKNGGVRTDIRTDNYSILKLKLINSQEAQT